MINVGQIISYIELAQEEKAQIQKGMNFRFHSNYSIVLMSRTKNAPYSDKFLDDGDTIEYEGHNASRKAGIIPEIIDQPGKFSSGKLTENGKFEDAAKSYKKGIRKSPEIVKVYEKLKRGIWVYNGKFALIDSYKKNEGKRKVYKFLLKFIDDERLLMQKNKGHVKHSRVIPSWIKQEVFIRDEGKCVKCGSSDNIHFDHDLPFSKGGTSLNVENIQLLCQSHNLSKSNKLL